MNIILCSGDQIQGQSIVLLEGKSIDMADDKNNEKPLRSTYPAEFVKWVTGNYYSTIEQLYNSWISLEACNENEDKLNLE